MKPISLVALSVSAALAVVPTKTVSAAAVTPAPAPVLAPTPAPAPSYTYSAPAPEATAASESTAPLAPIHDDLIQGNPALPGSIGALLTTPSDFYGKREAAFQWGTNPNSSSFAGTGLAVVDQYFVGFDQSRLNQLVNPDHGQIAGGYLNPMFGAGVKLTFAKQWGSSDSLLPTPQYTKESSSTYAFDGMGIFGSLVLRDLVVYANMDWVTPVDFNSSTYVITNPGTGAKTQITMADRSDAWKFRIGAKTSPLGDVGMSWNANLQYSIYDYRGQGVSSDSTYPVHVIQQFGQIGKTFSAEGFVLAAGLDEQIQFTNGYGNSDSLLINNAKGTGSIEGPDNGYSLRLEPTLAVILPIFEHWSVSGGARVGLEYKTDDIYPGSKAKSTSQLVTTAPKGSVGVRYARGRWAAEALVQPDFLNNGPYLISGSGTGGGMLASLGLTANFK